MTTVIIVHGLGGHPNENWFPWLKAELEKLKCQVFVPQFPTPENQGLDSWLRVFTDYERYMGRGTILVGHSLGVAFILNLLEKYRAKAAFLVAGYTGLLDNPMFDDLNKSITDRDFDWKAIRKNCDQFFVYCSDNDWAVPLKKAQEVANNLKAKPTILHKAGHINEGAGFKKFEKLLDDVRILL